MTRQPPPPQPAPRASLALARRRHRRRERHRRRVRARLLSAGTIDQSAVDAARARCCPASRRSLNGGWLFAGVLGGAHHPQARRRAVRRARRRDACRRSLGAQWGLLTLECGPRAGPRRRARLRSRSSTANWRCLVAMLAGAAAGLAVARQRPRALVPRLRTPPSRPSTPSSRSISRRPHRGHAARGCSCGRSPRRAR